jgi:hypothetical protein
MAKTGATAVDAKLIIVGASLAGLTLKLCLLHQQALEAKDISSSMPEAQMRILKALSRSLPTERGFLTSSEYGKESRARAIAWRNPSIMIRTAVC